jgi:ferredoxin, 2Fe-2S
VTVLTMATVRVEPDGHEITVEKGESLIEAAWRQGYRWPTTCFGQAQCTACRVEIVAGSENVDPPEGDEADALATIGRRRSRSVRLACRLRPAGDMVVVKHGVQPDSDPRAGQR